MGRYRERQDADLIDATPDLGAPIRLGYLGYLGYLGSAEATHRTET